MSSRKSGRLISASFFLCLSLGSPKFSDANPFWDQRRVPVDPTQRASTLRAPRVSQGLLLRQAVPTLRVTVGWEVGERFQVQEAVLEASGTPALKSHATKAPRFGSYVGVLRHSVSRRILAYDSVGTGREFRKLGRAMTFRFPQTSGNLIFEMIAEHPETGRMERVLTAPVRTREFRVEHPVPVEVRELKKAQTSHSVRVVFYAEGYLHQEKEAFFNHASKALRSLHDLPFPGFEFMNVFAAFAPSEEPLGDPKDRGFPIPIKKSFLGLDYPYWNPFGRWFHVVYPTDERHMRRAMASIPYDFPIALVNESSYWGVGNFMSHTAVPARAPQLNYLLHHELGHFFGLNEEYEGGGKTELEFAEAIEEPWSQNITFLRSPVIEKLKWREFVRLPLALPTPRGDWSPNPPRYGAYRGGYADSKVKNGFSHKPGFGCVMSSGRSFCEICKKGILDVIRSWLPESIASQNEKR